MRFFNHGVGASIVVFLSLWFFPSVVEAKQNSCDPDGEFYDARVCFEHVRALETKNANAKRDLVVSRRDTSVLKSQIMAAEIRHIQTASDLGFAIELRNRMISSLGKTIEILSEEKETAWGYVDVISKTLAVVIGLGILGGIIGFYFLRKHVSRYDRYAIEVRDEKIRTLTRDLHDETAARLMARDDASVFRRELFHKNPNLWMIRASLANLLQHVKKESPRFETIREAIDRMLLLLRTDESRLEQFSSIAPSGATR